MRPAAAIDKTCKAIENRMLDRVWSYDADGQGRDAGTVIDILLQGARRRTARC